MASSYMHMHCSACAHSHQSIALTSGCSAQHVLCVDVGTTSALSLASASYTQSSGFDAFDCLTGLLLRCSHGFVGLLSTCC